MGLLGLAMGKKPWPIIGMGVIIDLQRLQVGGINLQSLEVGDKWLVSVFQGLKGLDAGMGVWCSSGGIIAGAGRGRPCVGCMVGVCRWCFAGLDDGWIYTTSPLSN